MPCRDFVAFVGAIGFTPMDFILPIILWQKVGKHSLIVSLVNWTIVIFYSIIAVAGTESMTKSLYKRAWHMRLMVPLQDAGKASIWKKHVEMHLPACSNDRQIWSCASCIMHVKMLDKTSLPLQALLAPSRLL